MLKMLSKVSQVFKFKDYEGCILEPGIPADKKDKIRIKVGDKIELRIPNGNYIETYVAGIMMICRSPNPTPVPIMVPKEIIKEDILIGTEIWIEEDKIMK